MPGGYVDYFLHETAKYATRRAAHAAVDYAWGGAKGLWKHQRTRRLARARLIEAARGLKSYGTGGTKRREGKPKMAHGGKYGGKRYKKKAYKKKSYKKKSYKKKGKLQRKGTNVRYVGRNWPPTEMIADFENNFTIKIAAAMSQDPDCLGAQALSLVDSLIPEDSLIYQQNTVAGTAPVGVKINTAGVIVPTLNAPRNWNVLSADYLRARPVSTKWIVRFNQDMVDPESEHRGYDVWTWMSSDQDALNPLKTLGATPADAAFISGAWFEILNSSRRVKKHFIRPVSSGRGSKTITFKVTHNSDRLKNKIGSHVSVATNHPHGVTHPMDRTVAAYESSTAAFHGVHNVINIVWCPKGRQAGQIQNITVKHMQRILLYDCIHDTI